MSEMKAKKNYLILEQDTHGLNPMTVCFFTFQNVSYCINSLFLPGSLLDTIQILNFFGIYHKCMVD